MKVLKLENCDGIYLELQKQTLTEYAQTITLDLLSNYNDSNKILCQLSKRMKNSVNPKMYFHHHLTLYSLEFIVGEEEVLLGRLHFTCSDTQNIDTYIENLLIDPHRVWSIMPLHYDKPQPTLNNQVLTLLRICKIDKEAYLANPDILSKRFTK
jgi:hypothetical protein